jgi:hypothetical protein
MRNCTRDEGWSFEVGNQVLISSHRKLLSLVKSPIACAMQHGVLQWVICVASMRSRPSRHVRYASNSDRIPCSQQTVAMCHKPTYAVQQKPRRLFDHLVGGGEQ